MENRRRSMNSQPGCFSLSEDWVEDWKPQLVLGNRINPWRAHESGQGQRGFCQHATVLFPTWHRVHLWRLEQALETVGHDTDEHVSIPYRDQTSRELLEKGVPQLLTDEFVMSDGKKCRNPLVDFEYPRDICGEELDSEWWRKFKKNMSLPIFWNYAPASLAPTVWTT